MGFIGSFITPMIGFSDEDKLNCYYIIDEIIFNSNLQKTHEVSLTLKINIYPSIEDRNTRINLLGSDEYDKIISRSEFSGNILGDYYIYCKPLIIDNIKNVIKGKLELDITDEIPSEYSQYYSLTDHV
jgi:hypothetical protein|tara:strand:+ start:308 stop:691 length:384 start_codon:yes stop_codon:yes gene_type:complete